LPPSHRFVDRRARIIFPGPLRADNAVVIDAVASIGATLAAVVRGLRRHGVRRIIAIVVPALFAPGALGRICGAGARNVISCDTVPHPN